MFDGAAGGGGAGAVLGCGFGSPGAAAGCDIGGAVGGVMADVQALFVLEKVPSRPPVEGEQALVTFAHDQGDRSRGEGRLDRRPHSKNEQLVLEAREVSMDCLQLHTTARQALMSGRQRRLQPAVAGRGPPYVGADAFDTEAEAIAHVRAVVE